MKLKHNHATHHLVDHSVSAVKLMGRQYVLVYQDIWDLHQLADLSVLSIQTVISTKHVPIKDVVTHALVLVVLMLGAKLSTIILSAAVSLVIQEILSQDANQNVSCLCFITVITTIYYRTVDLIKLIFYCSTFTTTATSKSMPAYTMWTIFSVQSVW